MESPNYKPLFLFLVVFGGIFACLTAYLLCKGREVLLREWCEKNGLTLVRARLRFIRTGPYFSLPVSGSVFYFEAIDERDNRRFGYAICDSKWFAEITHVTVTWEGE